MHKAYQDQESEEPGAASSGRDPADTIDTDIFVVSYKTAYITVCIETQRERLNRAYCKGQACLAVAHRGDYDPDDSQTRLSLL